MLSQFWPDAAANKKSFPLRNATMSGYSRATIIAEAGETSGARIQARVGVEHGRAVILRDHVIKINDWAKALQRRPGVYVVSGVDEVLGVVAVLRPDLDDVLTDVFAKRAGLALPEIELVAGERADLDQRAISASRFMIAADGHVHGRHVLLIEDTWTSGGNAQSAVLTLRRGEVTSVTIVALARWLNPEEPPAGEFVTSR